jgi:predicted nucleic acid-binding protein
VWTEVVEQGGGFPVGAAALQAIRGTEVTFGRGEVIRLAEELAADIVLIDDRAAVVQARAQGFRVVPTIAIYIEAKRKGLIGSIKEKVDQLRAARFRLTERDYRAILAAAGEL